MSSRHPVIWYEGLFVKPQHFQQQARAAEAAVQQRLNSLNDTLYGFSELALNSEYLSFGKIALTRARGIMPDGSVFDIPTDQAPPTPLEITDSSAANQTVFLTLPLKSAQALEIRWPEGYANSRYLAQQVDVRDTHSEVGDVTTMNVAVPNLKLMLEDEDRSAFTCIAVGKILDKRPDGSLVMDEHFYPTCVSLQAVPVLQRYLGEVAGQIRERAKNLAERIGSSGQSGVADEVRGLAQRTQKSTEEIQTLVAALQSGTQHVASVMHNSRTLTDSSVTLTRHAGTSLQGITRTVSNIQSMNQQIAAAAEQQSAVAEEISRSIVNVRDVSEQTAAASDETAKSSVELARLGNQLQEMVSHFKV